jgi:hypothetical protein
MWYVKPGQGTDDNTVESQNPYVIGALSLALAATSIVGVGCKDGLKQDNERPVPTEPSDTDLEYQLEKEILGVVKDTIKSMKKRNVIIRKEEDSVYVYPKHLDDKFKLIEKEDHTPDEIEAMEIRGYGINLVLTDSEYFELELGYFNHPGLKDKVIFDYGYRQGEIECLLALHNRSKFIFYSSKDGKVTRWYGPLASELMTSTEADKKSLQSIMRLAEELKNKIVSISKE